MNTRERYVVIDRINDIPVHAAADEPNGRPHRKLGYCTAEALLKVFLHRIYAVASLPVPVKLTVRQTRPA